MVKRYFTNDENIMSVKLFKSFFYEKFYEKFYGKLYD